MILLGDIFQQGDVFPANYFYVWSAWLDNYILPFHTLQFARMSLFKQTSVSKEIHSLPTNAILIVVLKHVG